jgi:hypothetical protein
VEYRYSSTLSLTSALDVIGWSTPRPGRFTPGTHCIGGWVGPRGGLDGYGKSRPTGIRSPNRKARSESLYGLSYPDPCIKFEHITHVIPPSHTSKFNKNPFGDSRFVADRQTDISNAYQAHICDFSFVNVTERF